MNMATAKAKPKAKVAAKAKAPVSEKREYKTPESAAKQKVQWEKRGYTVTRKGCVLYLKKG
jgi:hypothetical protein